MVNCNVIECGELILQGTAAGIGHPVEFYDDRQVDQGQY
jgi:hypothetical protein